ncbi:MAG: glycosyltransferase family 2 protein [Bacteroidetes bacterium]|nr:glycosyltransferase family 2 protein [Bacteroidota bacterium]
MKNLSIVIPAKDEAESIPELLSWINRVVQKEQYTYEVIFIDDGSTDQTWEVIRKLASADSNYKAVRLNRNFGKSAALQTGFQLAEGEVVITMDADLQDSPDEIPSLYRLITEQGFDLVSGWKKKRHDPITKTLPSKFFNLVTRKISGIDLHDFNCGLKAYRKVVVKNIRLYGEMHRYIPLLSKWAGFSRITEKEVEHHERKFGVSKYGWERMMRGFLDLLTITFVGKFAQRPMHFFGSWGVLWFLAGLGMTAFILWQKVESIFITGVPVKREVTEQPIFYLALVAVLVGSQLFLTGFIAELIARQSLSRRDYLAIEKINC